MSQATLVRWHLEALQVPYEFVLLDMRAGGLFSAADVVVGSTCSTSR